MAVGPDLLPRVASAMLLAPVVLFAAFVGGWPFAALLALAAVLVLWEWLTMIAARPGSVLLALGGGALVAAQASLQYTGALMPALAIALFGVATLALVTRGGGKARLWALSGMVYAAGVVFPAHLFRADPQLGLVSLGWLLAVVWTTDIAAYFCGRLIGGPKLWPRVSPNKTWSGALGGAGLATLAGVLVVNAAGIDSFLSAAPVAFAVSAVSQAGDLFESSMKRRFGVKDSSQLIPGHGGLMDRLDGFIVGAALALAIGLIHAPDAPARGLLIW